MSSISILENLFNQTLTSPEFQGFVTSPQQPNEAATVFGRQIKLGENESRNNLNYQLTLSNKKIASFVAKGATEYSTVGYDTTDTLSQGIGKIAVEHSYTLEDVDAINQYAARFGITNFSENYQGFLDEISLNPVKLTDAIANAIDLSAWFGGAATERLRKGAVPSLTEFNQVRGIFQNPNVTQKAVANDGTGATDADKTQWINKDIQKVIRDLTVASNAMENEIFEKPDTIVLSSDKYNYLAQTIVNSSYATNITYLDTIKKALPDINFVPVYILNRVSEIDDQGDRFIIMKRRPEYFSLVTSAPAIALPMEIRRDIVTLSFKAYTAGVVVRMPSAIKVYTGI